MTGRKGALETRRPFGREPGALFVSGCVGVIARKLTYGNFVAIPAIAENKNTRRYWEDFWLPREDFELLNPETRGRPLARRLAVGTAARSACKAQLRPVQAQIEATDMRSGSGHTAGGK